MPPVLIDTNLLVYLYDHHQPAKQAQAERILEHLELSRGGRLSVQSLAEFLSVVTRKLSPRLTTTEALHQVSLLIRLWPAFDLTALIVLQQVAASAITSFPITTPRSGRPLASTRCPSS